MESGCRVVRPLLGMLDFGDFDVEECEHHFLFEDVVRESESFGVFDVLDALSVCVDEVGDVVYGPLDELGDCLGFGFELDCFFSVDGRE